MGPQSIKGGVSEHQRWGLRASEVVSQSIRGGVSEHQRWGITAGCGQGSVGLCHTDIDVGNFQSMEMGKELGASCHPCGGGNFCCSVFLVDFICPCSEMLLPCCPEVVLRMAFTL